MSPRLPDRKPLSAVQRRVLTDLESGGPLIHTLGWQSEWFRLNSRTVSYATVRVLLSQHLIHVSETTPQHVHYALTEEGRRALRTFSARSA